MDRRELIKNLFPNHLKENADYSLFIDLTAEELGIVSDYIEMFSSLSSIRKAPVQFVELLGNQVSFSYSPSQDVDAQREAIKRIFTAYEQRGTEESILKAADFSQSYDWVAGDIFLTKNDVPVRYATIVYRGDQVFTYSRSKYSGSHHYQDSEYWRSGVVVINLNILNDRVREALTTVMPAGTRYFFDVSEYDEVSYGELPIKSYSEIEYQIPVKKVDKCQIYSGLWGNGRLLSGEKVIYNEYNIDYCTAFSFISNEGASLYDRVNHSIDFIKTNQLYKQEIRGIPKRSTYSSKYSNGLSLSGLFTGETYDEGVIGVISPSDIIYPMSAIWNLTLVSRIPNYVGSVEITISE